MSRLHPARIATLLAAAAAVWLLVVPAASPAAKLPGDFFGIFAEAPGKSEFKAMGKAGFGSYRVPINWRSIQKTRNGDYDFSQSDYGVYQAAKHHMRPVPVVYGTPRFIHKSLSKGLYPPKGKADLNEWRNFMKALAERYSPKGYFFDVFPEIDDLPVKTWMLWNEQNSKNNWLPKANPRAYAKVVKKGDQGISKVDPKAKVVLGGMYGYPRDSKSMKAGKFLAKMYKVKGVEKHFDAVNSHPYGHDIGDVKKQVGELRSAARRAGDRNVGLYVGELGWASKGPAKSDSVVGYKGQANRLRDGLNLLAKKRKSWNVGGVFIYTWRDFAAGQLACLWCPGAGLVKQNGKAKPALRAVKKVIRKRG